MGSRFGTVCLTLGIGTLALFLVTTAEARTINVPGNNGKSIQDAVDKADPGDKILVHGRRYPFFENVVVATNRLTIAGVDRNGHEAVVDGTSRDGNTHDETFDIDADNVTVKNLRSVHGNAIECDGDGCSFENLIVNMSDQSGDCIEIDGRRGSVVGSRLFGCDTSSVDIDGNRYLIKGNRMVHGDSRCVEADGNNGRIINNVIRICEDGEGINVDGDDNLVADNFVKSVDNTGIEVDGDGNAITDNRVANTDDSNGMDVDGNRVVVSRNVIVNANGGSGCLEVDGIGAQVKSNVILDCNYRGIDVEGENMKVIDNVARNVGADDGIQVDCQNETGGEPEADACKRAVVSGNTTRNSGDDDESFSISDSDTDGGMLVKGNRSFDGFEEGFDLDLDNARIVGNVSRRDGAEGSESGFQICGKANKIIENRAINSGEDGIQISSCGNRNLLKRNFAKFANLDGIHVEGGGKAVLRGNKAVRNLGDGIENDGTDTKVIGNTSSGNRKKSDCTNDGTIAAKKGNRCEDGSNFNEPGNINRVPRNRR